MSLQATLALAITIMVAAIGALFVLKPPDPSNQLLTGLISTITTVFVMVFSYYFGSSPGSKEKDETIKQIALGTTGTGPGTTDEKVPALPTKLTSVTSGQQTGT